MSPKTTTFQVVAADLPAVRAMLSDAADEIGACHRLIRILAKGWEIDLTVGDIEAWHVDGGPVPLPFELAETLAAVLGEES